MTEDRQLIADCLDGRHAAYGELVSRYQDKLYNCLRYLLGCGDQSRSVVEKTFVEAFENLAKCADGGFAQELYRIALAHCLSQSHQWGAESGDGRDHTANTVPPNGAAPIISPEDNKLPLEQMLTGLERLDRAVLVLREIDGYCYETIGQILDRPVDEVRMRLCRARVRLRPVRPRIEVGQQPTQPAATLP